MVFVDPAGRAACPHAAVAGVLRYGCLLRVGDNAPYQFCNPIAKTSTRRRDGTPPCRNAFRCAGNADCAAFSGYMRGGGGNLSKRSTRVICAFSPLLLRMSWRFDVMWLEGVCLHFHLRLALEVFIVGYNCTTIDKRRCRYDGIWKFQATFDTHGDRLTHKSIIG